MSEIAIPNVVITLKRYLLSLSCILTLCAPATVSHGAEPQKAIFAGGCFWCMEPPFDELEGVLDTISGYTGGHVPNPDYQEVSSGETGHAEAVQVTYDPKRVSYEKLLEVFWRNIDPLDGGGQFCDRGSQYRSEIFYLTPQQKAAAEKSKQQLIEDDNLPFAESGIATQITQAHVFFPAEDYHQNYYQTNPKRFKFYKWNCGRQKRLDALWGND